VVASDPVSAATTPETTGTMPHAGSRRSERSDPRNLAAAQEILIQSAQHLVSEGTLRRLRVVQTAPKGAFRSSSAKKRSYFLGVVRAAYDESPATLGSCEKDAA